MPPRTVVRRSVITQKMATKVAQSANPRAAVPSLLKLNQVLKKRQNLVVPHSELQSCIEHKRFISSTYSVGDYGQIEELPDFDNVQPEEYNNLFRKYLLQCKVKCNFNSQLQDVKNIQMKTNFLNVIIKQVSSPDFIKIVDKETLTEFFQMLKSNIIRYTPPIPDLARVPMIGDDITDTIIEASWPHLELVYKAFQSFLENPKMDPKSFVDNITQSFVHRLISLFNTPDIRERTVLKLLVHRLYLRFNVHRPLIRTEMQNALYTFLFEDKFFCGVNEILEIFMSIINGYSVPLKQEHLRFFHSILLPLHGSDFYHSFADNLAICIGQYVQKDASLMVDFFKGLLTFWPKSSTVKEVMFIEQLDHILEVISDDQFDAIRMQLFDKIGDLVQSNAFRVSEAAMILWRNDRFVELSIKYSNEILPIITPRLYATGMQHWNSAIKNLAVSVIRICMDSVSPEESAQFNQKVKENEEASANQLQMKKQTWLAIEQQAFTNNPEMRPQQA
ncbi:phosphoprotein phosphatase, putative [Trichomonas vaginalis G3]|uniref:Phosphoprotein phosphatase, putative n=1 Tax=Trichomonas vaginalis (strain ATCC PRA-98 / G3) TaxID=412133 RepID=A2ERX6_TRIV3|nr:protein phosphatase regulator protein [Trichomonas vaginalis G3]EAY04571.1 phosphoprotein phosphatase, putative [Trichomonas vaginalis G3]KAI5516070.1 protein phosphatase regulator protein [Trichomonas vaginalis G3]|eukprot:XP_001316794.1 phosphoprotein phosphatase [Trichomonas vaginalis G3]